MNMPLTNKTLKLMHRAASIKRELGCGSHYTFKLFAFIADSDDHAGLALHPECSRAFPNQYHLDVAVDIDSSTIDDYEKAANDLRDAIHYLDDERFDLGYELDVLFTCRRLGIRPENTTGIREEVIQLIEIGLAEPRKRRPLQDIVDEVDAALFDALTSLRESAESGPEAARTSMSRASDCIVDIMKILRK
jgi:hypothetical protein